MKGMDEFMANMDLTDIIKSVRQPSFDDEMIKKLIEGLDISVQNYYKYIQNQNRIESSGKKDNEAEQELWKKKAPGYKQGEHFRHMGSTSDIDYAVSRLYVNCSKSDLIQFAQLFTDKCNMQQIPIYFKYSTNESTRADQIVIYSNLDNLSDYVQILQEIAQENPEMRGRMGEPPLLTGRIDEWIGIGDEPTAENTSYSEIRANIIENVLRKVVPYSIDEEGFEFYDTENIDYDMIRAELRKAFEELGINIDTFAFNNENLQLYMSDPETRRSYSEQRKQQIKDDKKRILENKRTQEYYLGEQVPIQELRLLKQMGFMPEVIETMVEAISRRYNLLTDITGKRINTSDFLQTKFSLPASTVVSNKYEIQSRTPEGIVDISEEQKEKLSSLLLSDLTEYYSNFFHEEQAILDETLNRYSTLIEFPAGENADLDLARTDLSTKLMLLAKGKEFFRTIGISEDSLEEVCDRIEYFLQDLEQQREEKERPEREERRKLIDREYLEVIFQEIGITDPAELRRIYESQDKLIVDEDDLEAVLATFSDNSAPVTPFLIETAAEKTEIGLNDIKKSTQKIRTDLTPEKINDKDIGDETKDEQ